MSFLFVFFNDTATTEIYTLSLHDALPISGGAIGSIATTSPPIQPSPSTVSNSRPRWAINCMPTQIPRSEEHTSELQSRQYLVCRLLLEKKKKKNNETKQHPARLQTLMITK